MVAGATLRCAAREGKWALPSGPRSPAVNAGPSGLLYTIKKGAKPLYRGDSFASGLALERGGKQNFGGPESDGRCPNSRP